MRLSEMFFQLLVGTRFGAAAQWTLGLAMYSIHAATCS